MRKILTASAMYAQFGHLLLQKPGDPITNLQWEKLEV